MKKNMNDKVLFGVCSGLAKEFQIDAAIVRTGFVIAALMGFGVPVMIYLVLAITMPTN